MVFSQETILQIFTIFADTKIIAQRE